MRKVFLTYGNTLYAKSRERIMKEAAETGEFTDIFGFSEDMLSKEIKQSPLMNIVRGGGLWIWKPDIILKLLYQSKEGDIIVYADSGCTLRKSNEWRYYLELLEQYDIVTQCILQPTKKWTRKEIVQQFGSNPKRWTDFPQCCATVIIMRCSSFTKQIIQEWRDFMIKHPNLIMDVSYEERENQDTCFIENRHDQAVWSALVYKYISSQKIRIIWERIETHKYIPKQAIEATRLKNHPLKYSLFFHIKNIIKLIIKPIIFRYKGLPYK